MHITLIILAVAILAGPVASCATTGAASPGSAEASEEMLLPDRYSGLFLPIQDLPYLADPLVMDIGPRASVAPALASPGGAAPLPASGSAVPAGGSSGAPSAAGAAAGRPALLPEPIVPSASPKPVKPALAPASPAPASPGAASKPVATPAPAKPASGAAASPAPTSPSATAKPAAAGSGSSASSPAVTAPAEPLAALALPAPKSGEPLFDPLAAKKTPSRSVKAARGSFLEVPFGALGWMFLGEASDKPGIVYDSRRFDEGSLVFVFIAELEGEYLLEFMKQDLLKDAPSREYVAVSVLSEAAFASAAPASGTPSGTSAAAASAPSAPAATSGAAVSPGSPSPAPASSGAAPAASPAPATGPAVVKIRPPEGSPEAVLIQAKSEISAGRLENAASILLGFVDRWPDLSDESYILLARLYENAPSLKNMKKAHEYYKKVVNAFPDSFYWDEAESRRKYIERYYLRIK